MSASGTRVQTRLHVSALRARSVKAPAVHHKTSWYGHDHANAANLQPYKLLPKRPAVLGSTTAHQMASAADSLLHPRPQPKIWDGAWDQGSYPFAARASLMVFAAGAFLAALLLHAGKQSAGSPPLILGFLDRVRRALNLVSDEESEKFVPMEDLEAFGPLGILVSGVDVSQVKALKVVVRQAQIERPVPILVLEGSDQDRKMGDVLMEMDERDGQMPSMLWQTPRPTIIFSGFRADEVRQAIYYLGEAPLPPAAMAMAVPRGMDKSMRVLVQEIQGDFEENFGG